MRQGHFCFLPLAWVLRELVPRSLRMPFRSSDRLSQDLPVFSFARTPAAALFVTLLAHASAFAQTITRAERQLLGPALESPLSSFGASTAMTSGTAVVGASGQYTATVFDRGSSGVWAFTTTLTGSDTVEVDDFGQSVSISGTTIVVGSPWNNGKGAAYVFRKSGAVWSQIAKLTASDGAAGDLFGTSVAIEGDTVIVGAPHADIGGNNNQGAAYIFRNTSGNTFNAGSKITGPGGAANDKFGYSVATHGGDRAVMGAPFRSTARGSVYLFGNSGGTWSLLRELNATAPHASEFFGASVALSSLGTTDVIWIGATGTVAGGIASGSLQFYYYSSSGVLTTGSRVTPTGAANGESFGGSISAYEGWCAVGSSGATVGAIANAGCARVYRLGLNATASQVGARFVRSTPSPSDFLGSSVALHGERLLAGIPYADITAPERGAVASFKVNTPRGDIDDNGRGDVVWFDAVGGNLAGWIMNGLTRETGGIMSTGLGSGAEYCSLGDFYGDGKQCALTRLKSNGAFKISRLNGLSIASSSNISNGIAAEWRFLASADINGDGKVDVLLMNGLTGQVNGWLMDGATKLSGGMVGVAAGREFLATGDFDGDGADDILWRDNSDRLSIWYLEGLSASEAFVPVPADTLSRAWCVTAVGDFDGDRTDDLVLRHIGTASITGTGQVVGWLMHGANAPTAGVIHAGIALAWRTESCADLDGDGDDDILLRNRQTGDVNAWLMTGLVKAGAFVKNVGFGWAVLNGDDYNDDHGYDGNGCDDDGDDLNGDDYSDDHGGSDSDDNSSGGGGGSSGGGNETVSLAACINCVNAAMASNYRTVLEVEAEIESGVAYVEVLQAIHNTGQFIFTRYRASNASVVSTITFMPSAALLDDYLDQLNYLGGAIVTPSVALTLASAAYPGTLPHEVELELEASGLKWKIEMVSANGTVYEAVINAG